MAQAKTAKKPVARPVKPQTPSWNFVRPSLQLWRAHVEIIVVLILLPAVLLDLGETLLRSTVKPGSNSLAIYSHLSFASPGSILILIGFLWTLINAPAMYYFLIQTVKGKSRTIKQCYQYGLKRFWRLLGLRILVDIIIVIGFILLIVPGVIMLRRYYLAEYYLIDQDLSIKEAMQKSAEQSKPVSGYVYGVIGVSIVFGLIAGLVSGIIPLVGTIIGLLIGYIYLFGAALRYVEVSSGKKSPAIKD
ncbi:MAG: hypothetical protein ACREGF_02820 [Candidatus Saccharimonadales bacterium]